MTDEDLLIKISKFKAKGESDRSAYDDRWQRNIKLLKGIPLEGKAKSEITNRNKIFFRKIWATNWRLLASLHSAFLRRDDSWTVEGRDTGPIDSAKARMLKYMTKYRVDKMNGTASLFIKHLWAMKNILDFGAGIGKLGWAYNPELKIDGPTYSVYPLEQVYLDLSAETIEDMRYVIFESYLTREDLEEQGYENIDKAQPEGVPSNAVRTARYAGGIDPNQDPKPGEYPEAGKYLGEGREDTKDGIYVVWEAFWKENGVIQMAVLNKDHAVLKKKRDNPFGDCYPIIVGACLTEQHKLIGEGFPEPLEAPQESYNWTMNQRKENVELSLNPPTIVARYGGVDLNALLNRAPRKAVLADDIDAVSFPIVPDATSGAYREAAADEFGMQELSGVTPQLSGQSQADTASEAQINLAQGSAKIELYISIAAETYWKRFYRLLAKYIQMFETDETIFRIAKYELMKEGIDPSAITEVDDFDADVSINVGLAFAGKDQEIRQALLVLDRGAVYNQTQIALLNSPAPPPQGIELFNGNHVFKHILPILGIKELDKCFIKVPPPQAQPTIAEKVLGSGGPKANSAMAGRTAPQVGAMKEMVPQNNFQAGGFGGI